MHLKPEYAIDEGDLESVSFNLSSHRLSEEEAGFGLREFEPTPRLEGHQVGGEPLVGPPPHEGCCKITVTDVVITGTLHICDSDVVFPDLAPLTCTAASNDASCPSCNGLFCETIVPITDSDHLCPDGANMSGFMTLLSGVDCQALDLPWIVSSNLRLDIVCPCISDPHNTLEITSNWSQDVTDPEDLPGTYSIGGDFSADGQPDLFWTGTLVIERTEACRCPCRYMTVDATVTYTDCFGFSGSITVPTTVVDWESSLCCGAAGVSVGACFTEPTHSFQACWTISRPGNCNFVDNPWNLSTSGIDPIGACGDGTSQDIPTPPNGTYTFSDDTGHLNWVVTIACSDTP